MVFGEELVKDIIVEAIQYNNPRFYRDTLSGLSAESSVPIEAVMKTDLLRLGISFTHGALVQASHFKEKSYFIFSFDMAAQAELSEREKHAAPEEIALVGGPFDLKRTIVSVRVNPNSPYQVRWSNDEFSLFFNDELISTCLLQERPNYYFKNLSTGKPVSDIAPTIEWGYLIYLTAFRLCQYWGEKEECQFCDINENYRQQIKERSYTPIKNIDEVLEALSIVNELDTEKKSKAYTVTGGSITRSLEDKDEGNFYAAYAKAIEARFPGRWIAKAVVQALPIEEVIALKEAGYTIYHPNYEVWDTELFKTICPGKERYVGRDEWIERIVNAAEVFGPDKVIPNFVAGIELSKPHGFRSIDEAIDSTSEGLDYFMSKKICPRFTVWCVEPNTVLSRSNSAPPPLEYYIKLLASYRNIFRHHELPIPPGYGEAGVGNAVFSVSAFMDVL